MTAKIPRAAHIRRRIVSVAPVLCALGTAFVPFGSTQADVIQGHEAGAEVKNVKPAARRGALKAHAQTAKSSAAPKKPDAAPLLASAFGVGIGAEAFATAAANHLGPRDQIYAFKGWDIRFPSEGDTLLQDAGGIRSRLDQYGIGLIEFNSQYYAQNVLNTPLKTPSTYAPNSYKGAVGAGNQVYNGERPTFLNGSSICLSYDLSRSGVPDGQVEVAATMFNSSWEPFVPNVLSLSTLAYYQTAFDRKLEIEVGVLPNTVRFVGANVGANFTSTFGPAASIHVLLGMAYVPAPAVNLKYNLTDRLYSKTSVQRSDPVAGPTGNPLIDGAKQNPTGLNLFPPDNGLFLVNEIGYRHEAALGDPQTWIRAGGMYNSSRFRDFSKLTTDPNATLKGNAGLYVLGDRQLIQTAPGSLLSAYRGLYAGATVEYAPSRETPISQYYEGRLYTIGILESRPTDLVSFVYTHQVFSPYIADQLNPISQAAAQFGLDVPMANHASNSYTISYLAHLAPGLYLSAGLGYTDNPSATYFRGEGHALNVLSELVTVF